MGFPLVEGSYEQYALGILQVTWLPIRLLVSLQRIYSGKGVLVFLTTGVVGLGFAVGTLENLTVSAIIGRAVISPAISMYSDDTQPENSSDETSTQPDDISRPIIEIHVSSARPPKISLCVPGEERTLRLPVFTQPVNITCVEVGFCVFITLVEVGFDGLGKTSVGSALHPVNNNNKSTRIELRFVMGSSLFDPSLFI